MRSQQSFITLFITICTEIFLLILVIVFLLQRREITIVDVIISTVLILVSVLFVVYHYHSKNALSDEKEKVRVLRKKIDCTTATEQITYVEYEVATHLFVYWGKAMKKPEKVFDEEEYYSHIHPDDLPIARTVVDFLHSGKDESLAIEYRWLFTGTTKYSWQYHEIFPFVSNSKGIVTKYLAVCHKNNIWHKMDENIKSIRKKISFISKSSGLIFIDYDISANNFKILDKEGEYADIIVPLDQWEKAVHPDDLPFVNELLAKLRQRNTEQMSTEFRYKYSKKESYTWFAIDINAYLFDDEDRTTRYLILAKENDAWHKTYDEMIRLSNKAELLKMISRYLENLGRKVRTPLNAVMGFSDVMSDEDSEEVRMEYKKIISDNSAMILRMSDDILTLSKIEAGDFSFNRTVFRVSDFFNEVMRSKITSLLESGINICIRPKAGDFSVKLDLSRVVDIVSTILNYFASYTNGRDILIEYFTKDDGVCVVFSDPSFVIKEEKLKHVFERFDNIDNSSKYIPGIGLPICKAILSANKGKASVESSPEKGTVFTFWIPCEITL